MSRGIDREEWDRGSDGSQRSMSSRDGRSGSAASSPPDRRTPEGVKPGCSRTSPREEFRLSPQDRQPGRFPNLNETEVQVIRDIGRFRTIGEDDLLRFRYAGSQRRLERDYLNMRSQGLIERRTVSVGRKRKPLPVYSLTRDGKEVVKRANKDGPEQVIYAGFVKPREVAHDSAIYRMFRAENDRIEADGGRVRRVVLDFELKKKVFSPLVKARDLGPREYAQRQAEIAEENHLKVVDGKVPLPDLRIEYESAEGEMSRIDLELATEHYHQGQLSEKSRAGFKMYGFTSTSRGSRAEWEGRELTAGILAL